MAGKNEEQKWAGPGDSGSCPICGEEMAEKEYVNVRLGGDFSMVRGRYWHMVNEHQIWEHYRQRETHSRAILRGEEDGS